jgi:NAD(P)-dependent dehydrogenase (short-subunit alcohol dehydrogenase family)
MQTISSPADKAALVTGGAIRVGRAIALRLAREGYDIVLHHHKSRDAAQETAEAVRALGRQCWLLPHDLEDVEGIQDYMAEVLKSAPHLSLLVNSASIFEPGRYGSMSQEDYQRHMAINLDAPVFLTQAFALAPKAACVVNIADSFARRDQTSFFAYLLSKKSLLDFTRMAAAALAPKVRVNAISPGSMLPAPGFGEDYLAAKRETLPLKALPTPEEVAETVCFIAATRGMTGEVIHIDGGEQVAC